MPNALTRHVGLNVGTWVVETLVKHYFEQLRREKVDASTVASNGELRHDELFYDEAFHIVKSFLNASTHHTVEELQRFSNARTPSAPWMYTLRVLIPMSCCDAAATYLIDVLGGEDKTRQLVGGTKWWQVRGVRGVDAQWIVARKDYQQAKKRRKRHEQAEREKREGTAENEEPNYTPEMDEMRCILYFHGGGYYFGSVDQERYFLQRYARKAGCRLLGVTYRLAPQYPFPCAIQDALAAYLYLIRPPADAPHAPVKPAHIIISGNSAGGGLSFALLQVIRDSGLPLPAGGVLISPWCDLTHSFPSIHLNTETDVIPQYGLSMHRPSPLWPPPSDALTDYVQTSLRTRIRKMAHQYSNGGGAELDSSGGEEHLDNQHSFWRRFSFGQHGKRRSRSKSKSKLRARSTSPTRPHPLAEAARTGDVRLAAVSRSGSAPREDSQHASNKLDPGTLATLPTADGNKSQTISLVTEEGEYLEIHDQVQLYTPNTLVTHPLVSPVLSYLGGLPPLQIIVSDTEVLRDEIIYSAHKAAHPDKYPIKAESRQLYPKLIDIESRYGPTEVHLQIYDQTAHVLPVLFSFSTPAKFCFRSMASFVKYVTGTLGAASSNSNGGQSSPTSPRVPMVRRALSLNVTRRTSSMGKRSTQITQGVVESQSESSGLGPPVNSSSRNTSRTDVSASTRPDDADSAGGIRFAGNRTVYFEESGTSELFKNNMIRERVSIRGEIRPLESEDKLDACTMPFERVGVVNELAVRRYMEGQKKWNERYARVHKSISKRRVRNLDLAKSETVRNVEQLQVHLFEDSNDAEAQRSKGHRHIFHKTPGTPDVKEGLRKTAASWSWAWAIDGDERPPPSSIVARRDTEEARRLSKIADQPATEPDHRMSGNNLWSLLVNLLSIEKVQADDETDKADVSLTDGSGSTSPRRSTRGRIRRLLSLSSIPIGHDRQSDVSIDEGRRSSIHT